MLNIAFNNLIENLPSVLVIVICIAILAWILGKKYNSFTNTIENMKNDITEINIHLEKYQEKTDKRLAMLEYSQNKNKDNNYVSLKNIENRIIALEVSFNELTNKLNKIIDIITDTIRSKK